MSAQGFVTHTEYQKHIRGEWRTIHNLWPHIRKYVPTHGYSRANIDAMFEGYSGAGKALIDAANVGGLTPGSIPFAAASGFLTEDNAALFWDETNHWLGIRTNARQGTRSGLHIVGPDGVVAGAYYDNFSGLIVEANTHCYIQITSPSTHYGSIWFNDNAAAGGIRYHHPDDEMDFFIDGVMAFRIDTGGISVNKGDIAATNPLTVWQVGTDAGYGDGVGGVVARFRANEAKHTTIAIDARSNYDPILALSTNGFCQWDLRFDNSDADKFQIRYQGGNGVFQERADFQIDVGGNVEILTGYLGIKNNNELRLYDNGNYVGFEAPALDADQIWVLPDEDGNANDVLITSGAGVLSWSPAGAGDVTATAVLADHTLIRGNGGARGIQDTGIDIDDAGNITFPDGANINLQEDITFLGATTENLIKFPDNLPDAFSFMEGANPYLTFVTTNGSEAVVFGKVFTGVSGSTIGNLTFADGSITDSGGAISFGDENLSTSGEITISGTIDTNLNNFIMQHTGAPAANNVGWYFSARENNEDWWIFAYDGTTFKNFIACDWDGAISFMAGNIGIGTFTFGTNAVRVFAQATGTAPTTSPADCFQMYSADINGGHAACHIRNENNTIIKLYQQALIADPAGQANDLDSEARTAIDSILDILENNGLMADT